VQRPAAALPHDRLNDLTHGTRGDQAADRLVLEERLVVDVLDDPREQDPGSGEQRAEREG
jgi:hypothetical protein